MPASIVATQSDEPDTYAGDLLQGKEPNGAGIEVINRFSRLLQFPSVSSAAAANQVLDEQVFHDMIDFLAASYLLVWQKLHVEMMGAAELTMLLRWDGSDESLLPILFISHYDVVPITKGTEGDWKYPPFSGAIQEG